MFLLLLEASKPIATVSPTATTTTSVSRDNHTSFNVTRITRAAVIDVEDDRHHYDMPPANRIEGVLILTAGKLANVCVCPIAFF